MASVWAKGGQVWNPADGAPVEVDEVQVDEVGWKVEKYRPGGSRLGCRRRRPCAWPSEWRRRRCRCRPLSRRSRSREDFVAAGPGQLQDASPADAAGQLLFVVLEDDAAGAEEFGRPTGGAMVFQLAWVASVVARTVASMRSAVGEEDRPNDCI